MAFYSKNEMLNRFAGSTANPDVVFHLGLESKQAPEHLLEEPSNVAEYIKVLKKEGAEAVANVAYKPETITRLVRDSRKGVREVISRNPNLTMDQMEELFEKSFRVDNADYLASTASAFNRSFKKLHGAAFERALHTFMDSGEYTTTVESLWEQQSTGNRSEKFEDLPEDLRDVALLVGPLAALVSYRKDFSDLDYALKIWKEFRVLEPLFGFIVSCSWKFEEGADKLREAGVSDDVLSFVLAIAPMLCTRNPGRGYYSSNYIASSLFAVRMGDSQVNSVLSLYSKYPRLGRMITQRYSDLGFHQLREYFLFPTQNALDNFKALDMKLTQSHYGSRYNVISDREIRERWDRSFRLSVFAKDEATSTQQSAPRKVAGAGNTTWIFQRVNQIVRDDMRSYNPTNRENVARAILNLMCNARPESGPKLTPESVGYILGSAAAFHSCDEFIKFWAAGHRKGQPAKAADVTLALQIASMGGENTDTALNDAVARLYPLLVNSDQRRVPEIEGRSVCNMSHSGRAPDTWTQFLDLAALMANEYLGADPVPWSMAAELAVSATPDLTVGDWFETSLAVAGVELSEYHDGTGLGEEDDTEDDSPQYETLRLFE